MAIKKSELYSSIWQSCDELRGSMDASQYKDYVLVILFLKYVSDKAKADKNSLIEVPADGSFDYLLTKKGTADIGDVANKVIGRLAKANGLEGIIDNANFNDEKLLGEGQDLVDLVSNLIGIFESNFDFSRNRADDDDILGDAYEFLMRHFATESGKSKGQFYTPGEVSRVMSHLIGINKNMSQEQTIYDPTCGSGSLLLKAVAEAKHGITIYGQEKDNATRGLAKMNMILHGNADADIEQGNTITSPKFKENEHTLKRFDYAVANPPFSTKSWSNGLGKTVNDRFNRFQGFGMPPAKNGDYAFFLHLLASLKSTGKGAIILPHGVLFRGNAEAEIRQNVVKRGYIKAIVGLPPNLFYGTGIPACIIVIDKESAATREDIFMIDASKGFVKDGNKNRLREQDIHKIVDAFNSLAEIPKYSRIVPIKEIADNEYNLNIPRYIDSSEPEDLQDIDAHLNGGIPNADIEAMSAYWEVMPELKRTLFKPLRPGYSQLAVESTATKDTIYTHPDFEKFAAQVTGTFDGWQKAQTPLLLSLGFNTKPKELIQSLSESLLQAYAKLPLLDTYDIYQHLMTYWSLIMRDDVYMISEDGWKATLRPVENTKHKIVDYTCELIPEDVLVAAYYASDKASIDSQENKYEQLADELSQLREEQGAEEGLLYEVIEDGKITKTVLTKRFKEIKDDPNFADELTALTNYQKLLGEYTNLGKTIKVARQQLHETVLRKYKDLTEDEVKDLVVHRKWLTSLSAGVQTELHKAAQQLAARVRQLSGRYAVTLLNILATTDELAVKVEDHLKKMGIA